MSDASLPPSSGKLRTFGARLFSTVILLGILVAVVCWGNVWGYRGVVCILCMLTAWEWGDMLRKSGKPSQPWLATVFGMAYPLAMVGLLGYWELKAPGSLRNLPSVQDKLLPLMVGAPVLLIVMSFIWEMRRVIIGSRPLRSVAVTVLSFIYPVWMFSFAFLLTGSERLCIVLLLLILLTKASDIFAYVSGLLLGGRFVKRKLIPHISPKKTWEGLIGSYLLTMGAGVAVAIYFGGFTWQVLPGMTLLFLLAVTGDLAGSLIKRSLALKDSSAMLPGIGGFFDLIDSMAFTLSCVCVWLMMSGI
jgi:phosphatidate cytidylyltransferase